MIPRLASKLRRNRRRARRLREDAGYSLVESVVALALLVTVLVPMAGTLAYFVSQDKIEAEIHALSMGQRFMEETIGNADFTDHDVYADDRRWRLSRTIHRDGGLVTITVRVYRTSDASPLVELQTARRS